MTEISKSVGYCLDGGGLRGAYQVGELKAAKEIGLPSPKVIQGLSVGALNAVGFILGVLEELWIEVIEKRGPKFIFRKSNLRDRFNRHLYSHAGLLELLRMLDMREVVESEIELQVPVFNRLTRRREIFTTRDPRIKKNPAMLESVILAGCSLNGVFPKVFINGIPYSDGELFFIKSLIDSGCEDIYVFSNDLADHTAMENEWALGAIFNRAHDSFDINFGDQLEIYHRDRVKKIIQLQRGVPTLTWRKCNPGDIFRAIDVAYRSTLQQLKNLHPPKF